MIYFDYNATAPVLREAREAWLAVTEKTAGNPSSMHQFGQQAAVALAEAREKRRDRGEQHGAAPFHQKTRANR